MTCERRDDDISDPARNVRQLARSSGALNLRAGLAVLFGLPTLFRFAIDGMGEQVGMHCVGGGECIFVVLGEVVSGEPRLPALSNRARLKLEPSAVLQVQRLEASVLVRVVGNGERRVAPGRRTSSLFSGSTEGCLIG